MSTITLTDVPQQLIKKFGSKVSFDNFQGLYRDGMDWCKYGEVIPTQNDKKAYQQAMEELKKGEATTFDNLKEKTGNIK